MEEKLRQYRALRRRQQLIDSAKEKIVESKQKLVDLLIPKIFKNMGNDNEERVLLMENEEMPVQTKKPLVQHITPEPEPANEIASDTSEIESFVEEYPESWTYFTVKWCIYIVIWLTLFAFFVKYQFGAVFFVVSGLVGVCLNTRTRPRKKGEVSAYSVFNENCESIDGTLKAEQFEREIRYGAGSVR